MSRFSIALALMVALLEMSLPSCPSFGQAAPDTTAPGAAPTTTAAGAPVRRSIGYRILLTAIDAETKEPIENAQITIAQPDGTQSHVYTTDLDGQISTVIRVDPGTPGSFHISGVADQYGPASADVTLTRNGSTGVTLPFTLNGTRPVVPIAVQNARIMRRFNHRVNGQLNDEGVTDFNYKESMWPSIDKLPAYHPVQLELGGPFGPIYGDMQLFFGFATQATGTTDYPNLMLNGTLNYGALLRGHVQANLFKLPFTTLQQRTDGLLEGYGELHKEGNLGQPPAGAAPLTYAASLRLGKVAQTQFPVIDPLVLTDRLPGYFVTYTGIMGMAEVDAPSGLGAHGTLYQRIGTRGTGGAGFLGDAYGLYRHNDTDHHLFYEGRLGWMPRSFGFDPSNANFGGEVALNYTYHNYMLGGFLREANDGTTFGGSITFARNPISELFGLAPSKILTNGSADKAPVGLGLEIPLARIFLFSAMKPTKEEPVLGEKAEIGTWNNGTGIGSGTSDVLPVAQWGAQSGKSVRRVVDVTPWWLYEDTFELASNKSGRRLGRAENYSHNREDITYSYYQVRPLTDYHIIAVVLDAGTNKPIASANLVITNPPGGINQRLTTDKHGRVPTKYRLPPPPTVPSTFHFAVKAPNYTPFEQDVPLEPNTKKPVYVTIRLRPLVSNIDVTVTDTVTNQPVGDAEIILRAPNAEPVVKVTNPAGKYTFADLRPGKYTISLHKPGFEDKTQDLDLAGGETKELNFETASQPGNIIGHVFANGNPVAGATVTITDAAGATVDTTETKEEGNFVARLKAGVYTLTVTATGYARATVTVTIEAGRNQNVTVTVTPQ